MDDPEAASAQRWEVVAESPLSARAYPSVVWSGREFLVWGGMGPAREALGDGAAYDPASDSWRPMAASPPAVLGARAEWAGDRLVVLSGAGGAAYAPELDRWTALPEAELGADEVGFTDAVWTGTDLLGIGVTVSDPPGTALLTVRRFDDQLGAWTEPVQRTVAGSLPTRSGHGGFGPVGAPDGFVLRSGDGGGWRYLIGRGWELVAPPTAPAGTVLRGDGGLQGGPMVQVDDRLIVLETISDGAESTVAVSELGDGGWTPFEPITEGWWGLATAVVVGDQVAVVASITSWWDPVLIDVDRRSIEVLSGYPLSVHDHGIAWSGEHLLVWGGYLPLGSEVTSTGDPRLMSAEGALWTS